MDSKEFSTPRHWLGTEELSADYWTDPKVQEKRGQEFFEKPVESIALIDQMDTAGIARRDFLTIMGASMAMAGVACARRPVHKIIPYVVKPEEITPGIANYYASTWPDTGLGVLIKTREGRPIKLEGNPDHPLSRGALSARGQAELLNLYDPDRLKEPVSRSRQGGANQTVSWQDADQAIAAKLKGASRVRVLTGPVYSDSERRLIQEFLGGFSSGSHVEFEAIGKDDVAEAQSESYGSAVVPAYRFDRAEVVVSLGADFLGTWDNSVTYASDWIKTRKLNSEKPGQSRFSKLVTFEPTMTLTGANSDERYPVRPGDELKIAMALAYELIVNRKASRFAGDSSVTGVLAGYKPETVAEEIGLHGGVESLKKTAELLWGARGRGVVVAGSVASKSADAVALQVATNLLNSALENEGATVDGTAAINPNARASFAAMSKLIGEMNAGAVDVLVVRGVNPAYVLPKTAGFAAAAKKVKLVVSIADRVDETGLLADYVLPDHHFLENWGDAQVRKGVYSIQQPAIAPLHSTRAFQDTLLAWIRAGVRANGLAARVGAASDEAGTWHEYLRANWRETVFPQSGAGGSFDSFWENTLRQGVLTVRSSEPSPRSFRSGAMSRVPAYKAAPAGLQLALYEMIAMGDGRNANNPWLQECPDSVSTCTWDNFLNVSPALAAKLGIKTHDVVEVSSGDVSVELPVLVQPGMHPSVVSAAIGYGRRSAGKVGEAVGTDVYPFVKVQGNQLVYSGSTVNVRKTGKFYQLALTQWHNASENRPVINDITLATFKKDPHSSNHTDPHLRMDVVPTMWPLHNYPGYRWGMAIDLTSCIGCGACVIGCQAENNVPVVGRNNVRRSREMHWLRIDRYYSGAPENPDVVFQPMLCQHCENAPCETVCPVLATVHNDEGLNEQAYNRCVGTRYCQNNCPYKVRRFNFFDHWKSYDTTMNMAWNPDVTVRSRGIMEKCTFCVQRIREVKGVAKDRGSKVKDGELKTACQQTCPTDAIVFGDINDPNSTVSKLRADKRAFRVLEVLNTRPSISYMTKVRNKEASAAEHGGAHH